MPRIASATLRRNHEHTAALHAGARVGRRAFRPRPRRPGLRHPEDRGRDPGDEGPRRGRLQPDGRRLRPGVLPHSAGPRRGDPQGPFLGADELPRLRRHPPAARGDRGVLPPRAWARLPGRRHPRHGRGPPAPLRHLQDAPRPRRRGPLPGPVVEQRPLRPPLRRAGGGDSGPRLVELLPDGRAARAAHRERPPPRPELARQPDRDRHRPGRAEEARRARPRREPPPRLARPPPPLPPLRPGLLDAHVRKRRSRDAGRPPARPRALHDPPRRHLEVVLRDGPEGRVGAHAARPQEPDGRHPRARRGLGPEARAGRHRRVPGPGGRDRSLPGRNEASASRSVSTSSTTASRR